MHEYSQYVSRSFLIVYIKFFDVELSRHERVQDRLEEKKKSNTLTIQLNQVKSLRRIDMILKSIYDVLRLRVYFSHVQQTFRARDSCVNDSLDESVPHELKDALEA